MMPRYLQYGGLVDALPVDECVGVPGAGGDCDDALGVCDDAVAPLEGGYGVRRYGVTLGGDECVCVPGADGDCDDPLGVCDDAVAPLEGG